MTYQEQLKHPKWQKKRLEVLERAEFTCMSCFSADKTLHVHHGYYEKGKKAWEYPDECYKALCEDCHKSIQSTKMKLDMLLSLGSERFLHRVIGYAKAILAADYDLGAIAYTAPEELHGAADDYWINPDKLLLAYEAQYGASTKINVMDLYDTARAVHAGNEEDKTWRLFNLRKG